jgi:hypothetical protein
MIAPRYRSVAGAFAIIASSLSCRPAPDTTKTLSGSLILSAANRVDRLDLSTRTASSLKDYGHKFQVDNVNFLAGDTLILEVCNVVTGCTIRALSLATGVDTVLGTGRGVTIDASTRTAFFYADGDPPKATFYSQDNRPTNVLYAAPLSRLADRRKLAEFQPPDRARPRGTIDAPLRPVILPTGKVAYVGADSALWSYDPRSGAQVSLGVPDCDPVLLRTRTGELICTSMLGNTWFLVNLARATKKELTAAQGAHSVVYDPGSDMLFLGFVRTRLRREETDIMALHLAPAPFGRLSRTISSLQGSRCLRQCRNATAHTLVVFVVAVVAGVAAPALRSAARKDDLAASADAIVSLLDRTRRTASDYATRATLTIDIESARHWVFIGTASGEKAVASGSISLTTSAELVAREPRVTLRASDIATHP